MSDNEFDMTELIQNQCSKRKRESDDIDNPIEFLQRSLTKNILLRLKSELKNQKRLNLRMYIKNFRSLLVKEQKAINRRMASKDVISFEDFLEKGTIEVTNDIIFKIFDDIICQKRKLGHEFNIITYLDEKLMLFDNINQTNNKRKKVDENENEAQSPSDDSDSDYDPREEEVIIDSDEDDEDDEDDEEDEEEYEESSNNETSDEEEYNITVENKKGAARGVKNLLQEANKQYETEFYRIRSGEEDDDWEYDECMSYFRKLSEVEKNDTLLKMNELENYDFVNKPLYFKILESKMNMESKAFVLKKLKTLESLDPSQNDYVKLNTWISKLMTVPFGIHSNKPVSRNDNKKRIKEYLDHISRTMDAAIWGHKNAKEQILQMMAQEVNNPDAKGNVMAVYGPMGNGKTTLVKEGIANAMGRPFAFISLGGATDSSFLEGHSYTYEGSICGKIVDVLIRAKCMDPIIYFDELDKVSQTQKGEEIINILMHLTDPIQNEHFNDKYFHGIDFDLSRATLIFSYNNPENISPILRDRLRNIETSYLKLNEKIHIGKNYLLPKILLDVGMKENSILFSNNVLKYLINTYTWEGGVRKFKEILYETVRCINLKNLSSSKLCGKKIRFPIKLTTNMISEDILDSRFAIKHMQIFRESRIGLVNCLYASSAGVGGIGKVEAFFMPSNSVLDLKLTGMQGDVMQESMHVAKTVAWHLIPSTTKKSLRHKWKNEGHSGIHIHCPEGATPKDGPSAGGAITTVLISLLTGIAVKNDIAMTGEIDLNGFIHEIGGLEEKLEGAKRAGVKLALYPTENEQDIVKIKKSNPSLIDSDFKVIAVENIKQILEHALERPINRLDETILHFSR
ncbi:Lon protease (S16) C-terminal proteolytic domain [seawater metagenome]|uniref:Lon protease (S16) C-terminal proteolytic domain n=1 Tax=seawater metagenome TaxID=1561972 RepID=A0A5E8CMH1_9ZZZZ